MEDLINHIFEPVYNKNSKILILGTMPSPKSRENGFYYSHPQNKFWSIVSDILEQPKPIDIEDKKTFLYKNNIALWDVLKSCSIKGADDNSIKNPVVNDFTEILKCANIKAIFTTGKKATSLYKKYCFESTNIESIYLPSTSPANCRNYNYNKLVEEYKIILKYLE